MRVRFRKVDQLVQILLWETETKSYSLHYCTVIEGKIGGFGHNLGRLNHTKKQRNLPRNISTLQQNPDKEEIGVLDNASVPILHIDKSRIQYCLEDWEVERKKKKKKKKREDKENHRYHSRNGIVCSVIL